MKNFQNQYILEFVGIGSLNKVEKIMVWGNEVKIRDICVILRKIAFWIFAIFYFKFCIDLITTRKIKLQNIIRKYNNQLVLFMFSLGTFQQWYIIWFFASLFWQSSKTIKKIAIISVATELANSVYMFNVESYKYDAFFWIISLCIFAFSFLCNKKNTSTRNNRLSAENNRH